jgi:hypothetical protein
MGKPRLRLSGAADAHPTRKVAQRRCEVLQLVMKAVSMKVHSVRLGSPDVPGLLTRCVS